MQGGQGANQFQQAGVVGAAMQQNAYGNQGGFGNDGFSSFDGGNVYSTPAIPTKSGNGKKIGIIIACIVLLAGLGVGAYFLFFRSGGQGSPEAVAEKFVQSIIDGDKSGIKECLPKEVQSVMDQEIAQLDTALEQMKTFKNMGVEFEKVKAGSKRKVTGDELDDIKSKYSMLDISDVYEVDVPLTVSFMGESQSSTFVCTTAKINGSWYIIDFSE